MSQNLTTHYQSPVLASKSQIREFLTQPDLGPCRNQGTTTIHPLVGPTVIPQHPPDNQQDVQDLYPLQGTIIYPTNLIMRETAGHLF